MVTSEEGSLWEGYIGPRRGWPTVIHREFRDYARARPPLGNFSAMAQTDIGT